MIETIEPARRAQPGRHKSPRLRAGAFALAALLAGACGPVDQPRRAATAADAPREAPPATVVATEIRASAPASTPQRPETLALRLAAIDDAVRGWRQAGDLATARRFAEQARNLVVGPAGPFYGDADGDGTIAGASDAGLLPGLGGQPGLASAAPNACVSRDVLGGDWSDPARRWQILRTAIANWKPRNNTFPKLPSHPQRVVGWATLALGTADLATARDHAGHAKLHVDISKRAVARCVR